MKSIPTLFMLDPDTGLATPQVRSGCEWVAQGQGQATRKYDGICCLFLNGALYKRRVVKVKNPLLVKGLPSPLIMALVYLPGIGVAEWEGKPMTEPVFVEKLPADFWACGPVVWDGDEGTVPGWIKVDLELPEHKHFKEAFAMQGSCLVSGRTYELVGPKINGNPEGHDSHGLIPHGNHILLNAPRTYVECVAFFKDYDMEGIVYRTEDGRMCRVKSRHFGHSWPRS